jgi:hypothetical protein
MGVTSYIAGRDFFPNLKSQRGLWLDKYWIPSLVKASRENNLYSRIKWKYKNILKIYSPASTENEDILILTLNKNKC